MAATNPPGARRMRWLAQQLHRLSAPVAPDAAASIRRRFIYDDLRPYEQLLAIDDPSFVWMNCGFDADDFSWVRAEDIDWKFQLALVRHTVRGVSLAGKRVLDVGSGRGGACWYVSRYHDASRVVGIDRSEALVRWCRRRFPPAIQFLHGDAGKLPCADGSFDVLVNVESAFHYPSLARFFREAARVLTPGAHCCHACSYLDSDDKQRVMQRAGFRVIAEDDITDRVVSAIHKNDLHVRAVMGRMAPSPEAAAAVRWTCDRLLRIAATFSERHRYRVWTLQRQ